MTVAAETTSKWSRRRRLTRARIARGSVPYLLILPVVAVLGALLAYPIYRLGVLSLQKYTLFELIQHKGKWIGLDNFSSVLKDQVFWHTLLRTVVFTVVNVGLTIVFGLLIALLLVRVSAWVRILLTSGLVLVWAMPPVVAVQVWYWMTNYQNGVVNYLISKLRIFGDFFHHDWYATTFSSLTLVTLPILTPVLLILTSLSILWDFGVFTQAYLLINPSHIHPSNYLMSIYLFVEGFQKADYGRGAAISILMLVVVAAMSFFYVRKMVKVGEVE